MNATTPSSISSPLVPGLEELPAGVKEKSLAEIIAKGAESSEKAAEARQDILFGAGDTMTAHRVGEAPGPYYLEVRKQLGFDPKKLHSKDHRDFDRQWEELVTGLRKLIDPDPADQEIRKALQKARIPVYQSWQYTAPVLAPLPSSQDTEPHDEALSEPEGSSAQDEADPDTVR